MKIKVLLILLSAWCMPVFSEYTIVDAKYGKNVLRKHTSNPYEYLKLYLEIQETQKTIKSPALPTIPEIPETPKTIKLPVLPTIPEIPETPKTIKLPVLPTIPEIPEPPTLSYAKVFAVVLSKYINCSDPLPKIRYADDKNSIWLLFDKQDFLVCLPYSRNDPQNQKLQEKPVSRSIKLALKKSLLDILNSIDSTMVPHIDGKANIDKLVQFPELIGKEIDIANSRCVRKNLMMRP